MKKYISIVILTLSTVITILIFDLFITNKKEISYELIQNDSYKYVYYVKDDELIGVPIKMENMSKYELIEVYFEYLSSKSNSVSKEYHTKLVLSSTLLSYEIKNTDLYLEVSDNFFDISSEDITYAIAQIVYSYQEIGYEEIFLIHNKEVVKEMGDIILYNGVSEVAINIQTIATSINRKKVKISYYYKNNTKTFINYFINENQDETTFKLNKIIEFLNTEYMTNITLDNYFKTDDELIIGITCQESDIKLIEKLLFNNFEIDKDNLKITII